MATYRALQDLYPGIFIQAGTVFTDAGIQGFVPPAAVDPIDNDAIQNFWNVGPQMLGLVRQQFTGVPVAPPQIYWTPYPAGGGTRPYILTGAGAALGFQNWTSTRGAAP